MEGSGLQAVAPLGGGGKPNFAPPPPQHITPPPHLTPAWSWLLTIFYHIVSIKKKIPKFFFGASRIISNRIFNYFLVFDLKKVSHS